MKGSNSKTNLANRFAAILIMLSLMLPIFIGFSYPGQVFATEKNDKDFEIEAKSAILYCQNTKSVIYKKNINEKMSPYSVTKLLTAMLVLENEKKLNRKVKISKEAAEVGGSTMYLKEGEEVTIKELLYGLLVVSGNDAAYALAEIVGHGDEKAFVKMMNKRAQKLGCKDTHFINSSGITDEKHYTTANDYLKITRAAFANKKVREIAGTKKYIVPATNKSDKRTLKTHTDLLETKNSGVISGKTGFDGVKEGTVSLEYDKDDLRLVLVILGDDQDVRPKDAKKIFKNSRNWLKVKRPVKKNEQIARVFIRGGEQTVAKSYAVRTAYAYMKKGENAKIKTKVVRAKNIKAPLKAGSKVGSVKVYVNGEFTAESPLVIKKDIKKGWLPSQIYISNLASLIIVGILIIMVVVFGLIKYKNVRKNSQPIGKHDARR